MRLKSFVSLLFRIFVYENVDNGNLHQWLHGCPLKPFSPLSWPCRMNIIQGIAKG